MEKLFLHKIKRSADFTATPITQCDTTSVVPVKGDYAIFIAKFNSNALPLNGYENRVILCSNLMGYYNGLERVKPMILSA